MSKKLTWIIGIFCVFFTSHSYADEISYAAVKTKIESVLAQKLDSTRSEIELNEIYASIPSKHAQKWLKDLLYKDFFFHRAAQDCYVPLANFFLDQITASNEIDEYLLRVRKSYGEISLDPYQQAVVAGCLPVVLAIDTKYASLVSMNLRSRMDPYINCNSNLHLMFLTVSQNEKTTINREMVKYFLGDRATPFLKNLDECKPMEVLDLNREHIENYHVIHQDISSSALGDKNHIKDWANKALENCRIGYDSFVSK
ncbi:MAG: hypothetical protein R2877_00110 [Bdellovibrionota bacterium]